MQLITAVDLMNAKNITKYLNSYAEPSIIFLGEQLVDAIINHLPSNKNKNLLVFEHVVVIPAYKESAAFIDRFLSSSLINQPVLCIVVINQPDNVTDTQPQRTLLNAIQNKGQSVYLFENIELIATSGNAFFLTIDAFSTPLPKNEGVGLARKLGADLALLLIYKGIIRTQWIHSTDADAHLPHDYFEATQNITHSKHKKDIAAVSYNFKHTNKNTEIYAANNIYEKALRYYVAGLSFARSQYNFFTIGSVIAFKTNEYATVRGFPKRSAGEDFYLLNKLAKLGRVEFLSKCVVSIDARESDRVPFGTGPMVSCILKLTQNNKAFCYYHPEVFNELKSCLSHFLLLWEQRFNFEAWLSKLSQNAQQALLDIKLDTFVNKQKNNQQIQFNKQLHVWFDAFKTLKFIHSLREHKYADIPLLQALSIAPFVVNDC